MQHRRAAVALGTDPNLADTDADGVNDGMEVALGTNPLATDPWATRDSDGDGLTDLFEINFGTDPFNPDTNGNGMDDGEELDNGGDPLNPGTPPRAAAARLAQSRAAIRPFPLNSGLDHPRPV